MSKSNHSTFKLLPLFLALSFSTASHADLIIEDEEVAPKMQVKEVSSEKVSAEPTKLVKMKAIPILKEQKDKAKENLSNKVKKPTQDLYEEKTVTLKEDSSTIFGWFGKNDKQAEVAEKAQEAISGKVAPLVKEDDKAVKKLQKEPLKAQKGKKAKIVSRPATEEDLKNLDKGYTFSNNGKALERSKKIAQQATKQTQHSTIKKVKAVNTSAIAPIVKKDTSKPITASKSKETQKQAEKKPNLVKATQQKTTPPAKANQKAEKSSQEAPSKVSLSDVFQGIKQIKATEKKPLDFY